MADVVRAGEHHLEAMAAVEAAASHHPWTVDDLAASLATPTTLAWVVSQEGRVVGHLLASSVLDEGEIFTLAVHPGAQRQGLARCLLVALAAAWDARGVVRRFLEVRADNAPAIALYARAGWTPMGVRRAYYADGTDALLFTQKPTA